MSCISTNDHQLSAGLVLACIYTNSSCCHGCGHRTASLLPSRSAAAAVIAATAVWVVLVVMPSTAQELLAGGVATGSHAGYINGA
jgi:hypothetical protein